MFTLHIEHKQGFCYLYLKKVLISVPDAWRFDTDPDPRSRTTWLRIRILILLFSSVTVRMQTKSKFFSREVLLITDCSGIITSVFKDNRLLRSNKTVEINFFLIFLLLMEGSKYLRIRNTGFNICSNTDRANNNTSERTTLGWSLLLSVTFIHLSKSKIHFSNQ